MTTLPAIRVAEEEIQVIGHRQALVRSHTDPDMHYVVEQSPDGRWHCTCRGFEIRKRCRHSSTVREWALGRFPAALIDPEQRITFAATKGDT